MSNAITAKNLCLWYGSAQALKNINMQILENNITALIGPSGCGKTTLLRILAGFLKQSEGNVIFDKEEISELASCIEKNPDTEVIIDIEKAEIKAGDKTYKAGIKQALQKSLLDGTYDTIYELMKNKDKVEEMDKNLPPKCFN